MEIISVLSPKNIKELLVKVRARDTFAVGRVLSMVEDRHPDVYRILSALYAATGKAFRVTVTGFPGAGKSTLIEKLARQFLSKKQKVAVVVVDPSGPLTGGALFGDRARFKEIQTHPDVFIRSMALRGGWGDPAKSARDTVDVLDAAGFDVIFLETAGVGQLELALACDAHAALAVLTPESGDEVPAIKASLTEAVDVFVVNKADRDRDGLARTKLANVLEGAKVFGVSAREGEGLEAVFTHLAGLEKERDAAARRMERLARRPGSRVANGHEKSMVVEQVINAVGGLLVNELVREKDVLKKIEGQLDQLLTRKKSPYDLARTILKSRMR
jgi:LAO/AO transport system kinase